MAAKKVAAESEPRKPKAVEVVLSDGRIVTLREPGPHEYLRLMAAQMALVKMNTGAPLTDADEANMRQAITLLSVGGADALDESDMFTLGQADWSRLFIGLINIMYEVQEAPLVPKKKSPKNGLSSPTARG